MSASYDPDPAADLLTGSWEIAFRAQRDVGLNIPVNYVTVPAVSLKAACFSHNQYENNAVSRCFSNLLASGFRRFVVDVYWDAGRSVWSLCPVEIPDSASKSDDSTSVVSISSTKAQPLQSVSIPDEKRKHASTNYAALPTSSLFQDFHFFGRQESSATLDSTSSSIVSILASSSLSGNATSSTTNPSGTPSPTEFPVPGGDPLIEVGPYNCTATLTVSFLNSVLSGFLEQSSTTVDAVLTYLIINIHAAAPLAAPSSPALQPAHSALPSSENELGSFLSSNLSSYLYTPNLVSHDRNDLNTSWFNAHTVNLPVSAYLQTVIRNGDIATSSNGWPTETYAEFDKFYRLIASYGTIDPQMANYNVTGDEAVIFPSDTIRSPRERCLFDANITNITPETNSSWAISAVPDLSTLGQQPNTSIPVPAITNLTSCGISPWLNTTLSNTTADQNPLPYLTFTHSTLWSWAPDQPINTSSIDSSTHLRCAALYSGPDTGRWYSVDCNHKYRAACQNIHSPYEWHITDNAITSSEAESSCPDNTTFSVPHTALENTYLYHLTLRTPSLQSRDDDDSNPPAILLNFNSLDVPNCWVAGVNSTCPYTVGNDGDEAREVVVPIVAAIIVFVCAALTFFVKCAANRREDKRGRRRRGDNGWDYEGVPS